MALERGALRRSDRFAWAVCALLLLATILNYLDRQVLSLTASKLIAAFHLNQRQFGQLIADFRYSYALVQMAGGWIVDAHGPRSVFPTAVGIWSAASILTAFSPVMAAIAACRILLGAAEAFNWPCALKTTERMLVQNDRALGNGFFNSGSALGALLAPFIVTIAVSLWGWRSPFLVTGTLGMVWISAWLPLTKKASAQLGGDRRSGGQTLAVFARIVAKRTFWLLLASAVIVNGVSYFLADWIPLYLQTERGFSFGVGNLLSALVYVGLDAGNFLSGIFIREATRFGLTVSQARTSALIASCLLMTCAYPAGSTRSRYAALACLILTGIGVASFLVIYLTLVQEVEPLHVGACAGLLGGLGNLCYGAVSPLIGHLADLHRTAWTFLFVGLLPWLSLIMILPVVRTEPERLENYVSAS
jgi:MFS transporter, ACS family, hexuronate transporter